MAVGNDLKEALTALRAGKIIAFPTETVFGLGVLAENADAVTALNACKHRSNSQPLQVLVPDIPTALRLGQHNAAAQQLAHAFWPGPLTLVVPARPEAALAQDITADTGTIGLRVPDHPLITQLLRELGAPIAATSANITGSPPCTSAAAVIDLFGDSIAYALEGTTTPNSPASSVIRMTSTTPEILREGAIATSAIHACLSDSD